MRLIDEILIDQDQVALAYGGRALSEPASAQEEDDDRVLIDAVRSRTNLVGHRDILTVERPSSDLMLRPNDEFVYHYVPSEYLNGFVNQTRCVQAIGVVNKLKRPVDAAAAALREAFSGVEFDIRGYGDDVVLIAESSAHYWLFLYSIDPGQCSIARIRRWRGAATLRSLIEDGYLDSYRHWPADSLPSGRVV